MLTLSKKLAAGIAATTAVAAVALAAPQAQAQQIYDFSFNGSRAGNATATTLTLVGNAVAGDPAEQSVISTLLPSGSVFTLNFPNGFPGAIPDFRPVNLAGFSLDVVPFTVTNNPQASFRTGVAGTFGTVQFTFEGDGLAAGIRFGKGAVNFTSITPDTFGATGFIQAVPEPMTMLGASAAVAFGAAFKRRQAKKG